ncbi:hypothetical protein TCE0_042r14577 [Talaromyces pinophilus]|uniref:Xylanolytic transcriptional activator regulatory domain-containing protein n=1 Tax=Talaromyces pinophilus TaxID=128442 RepID=A0A6V8HJJ3_TALPI|nr:hypothetical protein TCE0_042r14577 [Talaromyces pinophilus]
MMSRSRINRYLDDHGAPPPPGFSILLLSMCLMTYHPDLVPPSANSLDQETLYVTTKTLFGLVQASFPPSLHLIQATMIMATYEYANGKTNDAFASIGLCARMGYAAHIDNAHPSQKMEAEEYSENEAKANTWWNILMCERTFLCETDLKHPLSTKLPRNTTSHRDDETSKERVSSTPKSETENIDAGGFACVMQATYLLDQVIKALDMTDFESRYNQLHGLDHTLQTVLAVIMDQSQGRGGIYCTAIIILLRALIIIHSHNLTYITTELNLNPESILKEKDKRLESSHAAMKTIATMVDEISTTHTSVLSLVDRIPPSFVYVIREVIKYIENAEFRVDEWDDVESRLSSSSRKFEYRWGGRQIYA